MKAYRCHRFAGLAFLILFALGCSGTGVTPEYPTNDNPQTIIEREPGSERVLWGFYEIYFNPVEMGIEIVPIRNPAFHVDVTDFLLPPECDDCVQIVVNSFDTVTRILDVDVTLRNPTPINGRDVRGILYSNPEGHKLTNADDWTELWDIPGGGPLNPFKSFAKEESQRIFQGGALHTENYLVYIPVPPQYYAIKYAVDASWPGNCKEPYTILHWAQHNHLYDYVDAWALFEVGIFDWQYDVDAVSVVAPDIMGEPESPMDHKTGEWWTIDMYNNTGGEPGEYSIPIYAVSGGIALWDYVEIRIEETPPPTVQELDPDTGYLGASLTDVEIIGSKFLPPACQVKLRMSGEPDIVATNVAIVDNLNITCDIDIPFGAAPGLYDVEITHGGGLSGTGAEMFEVYIPIPDPVDVTPPWLNFSPYDVCMSGNYAYVAGYHTGFHIFDISDKSNPVWVNRVEIDSGAAAVTVHGDFAYVGSWGGGLCIVDINPPESAYVVNTVPDDYIEAVWCDGGYAYVIGSNDGLRIFDVDPPGDAYKVKTVTMIDYATDVTVVGDYAYMASGQSGLKIVDINPPEDASIIHTVAVSDHAMGVDIEGTYAYLSDGSYGLHIVDISTPGSASILSTLDTPNNLDKVAVSGGYVYAGTNQDELYVIDVDPYGTASIVNAIAIPNHIQGLDFEGGYVAVGSSYSGLYILDAAVPESAYVEGVALTPGAPSDTDVYHGAAYVANRLGGLHFVDVDPGDLAEDLYSYIPDDAQSMDVEYADGIAYMADQVNLLIIDVDPPDSMWQITSVPTTSGIANALVIDHGYAYVAAGDSGLDIFDIDPPETASLIKNVSFEFGYGVEIENGYAFVNAGNNGVRIVDIDPPETASVINTLPMPDYLADLAVLDGYAYCACGFGGLVIADIDPPLSAVIVNTVPVTEAAGAVDVSHGYAYVSTWADDKFKIIDVDPVNEAFDLTEITIKRYGMGLNVMVEDNYAYVMTGGLWIIQLW